MNDKTKKLAAITILIPGLEEAPAKELTEKIGNLVTELGLSALIEGTLLDAATGPCDDPTCKGCRSHEKGVPANATLN